MLYLPQKYVHDAKNPFKILRINNTSSVRGVQELY